MKYFIVLQALPKTAFQQLVFRLGQFPDKERISPTSYPYLLSLKLSIWLIQGYMAMCLYRERASLLRQLAESCWLVLVTSQTIKTLLLPSPLFHLKSKLHYNQGLQFPYVKMNKFKFGNFFLFVSHYMLDISFMLAKWRIVMV